MYELRRGVNDAKTFSINFSMDSSLLCSISSRGTCHIWKLDDSDERKSKFIEGKRSISQIQIPDFNSKLQSKSLLLYSQVQSGRSERDKLNRPKGFQPSTYGRTVHF